MTLRHLADRVATRLRAKERAGKTVTVRVRFAEMQSVTRSVTLPAAISATPILAEVGALARLRRPCAITPRNGSSRFWPSRFRTWSMRQLSNSNSPSTLARRSNARVPPPGRRAGRSTGRSTVSRDRFGRKSVGYASVALSETGAVPDEFRELAEKDG